jgi:two-component system, LytTR family, response regulator
MKAIIVEDEPPARRELRRLLLEFPWIEVIAEAGNIDQAASLIEALAPALIFLDIQMPGGSGFELLARLDHVPQVIFTTAHDEHAVRAFEVNALDYLLKPIDPARLAAALARVGIEKSSTDLAPRPPGAASGATPGAHGGTLDQLFVRDGQRCWFVPLREVRLLASEGNYVRLWWGNAQPLLGRALAALEQKLDPARFFRANRSQIINLDFIDSVELGHNGRLHAALRGGPEVEISRRQARLFKARTTV